MANKTQSFHPSDSKQLGSSLRALSDLLECVHSSSTQLTLATDLYAAGVRSFLAHACRGMSTTRIEAVAKALDLRTPEAALEAFLDTGME